MQGVPIHNPITGQYSINDYPITSFINTCRFTALMESCARPRGRSGRLNSANKSTPVRPWPVCRRLNNDSMGIHPVDTAISS